MSHHNDKIAAHSIIIESGRWKSIPKQRCICHLCLNNLIGDDKHYLFNCTNGDLLEIYKTIFQGQQVTPVTYVNGSLSMRDMMLKVLKGDYNILGDPK